MESVKKDLLTFGALIVVLLTLIWITGCSKDKESLISDPNSQNGNLTDQQAMQKLIDDDEDFSSFEPNYNEQGLMSLALGKVNAEIYPVKVGHRVVPVSKDLKVEFTGDTAYGLSTTVYSGTLFIAASYQPVNPDDTLKIDTVITKNFSSTITKKVMFIKKSNGKSAIDRWKIAAISLPEGGIYTEKFNVKKLTVLLPDDSLVITSPNEYFLYRNFAHKRQVPSISRGEQVKVRVEVTSAYQDTDFVSITYGADKKGFNRSKRMLKLVSSVPDGNFFDKVYEGTWNVKQYLGHTHAVINVIPRQVIYDDSTPAEIKTWGLPYNIK